METSSDLRHRLSRGLSPKVVNLLVLVGTLGTIAAGAWLRFGVNSALWLDEALTVHISNLPVDQIHGALKRDGAPPLYYLLLHYWMQDVGTTPAAMRALSGVFALATIPVVWFMVWRNWGRRVAEISVALLASAPYAIYYATEVRPYAQVIFFAALGMLAFIELARNPRWYWSALLALSVAGGMYTHYWTMYLVASGLVILVARWWKLGSGPSTWWTLGGFALGGLAFLPWMPTFLYQSAHTGTPWGDKPAITTVVGALTHFNEDQARLIPFNSLHSHVISALYLLLPAVALLGASSGRFSIDFDFRTRPQHRAILFALVGTMTFGIVGCIMSGSAFVPRYAAVAFIPLVIACALGTRQFADPVLRSIIVVALVFASLYAASSYRKTKRTQAPQVAAVVNEHAKAGDVLAFCPDQLGPSVVRLVKVNGLKYSVFPSGSNPSTVDWVNYLPRIEHGHFDRWAAKLRAMAGPSHHVWLVYAGGYRKYHGACTNAAAAMANSAGWNAHDWVKTKPRAFYQPMTLTEFAPITAPSRS